MAENLPLLSPKFQEQREPDRLFIPARFLHDRRGSFVTATPGHVTLRTRCYKCSRSSIASATLAVTSFRESIRRTFLRNPDFCRIVSATRECEMVTFWENVNQPRAGSADRFVHLVVLRVFQRYPNDRLKAANNFVKCFYLEFRIGWFPEVV